MKKPKLELLGLKKRQPWQQRKRKGLVGFQPSIELQVRVVEKLEWSKLKLRLSWLNPLPIDLADLSYVDLVLVLLEHLKKPPRLRLQKCRELRSLSDEKKKKRTMRKWKETF